MALARSLSDHCCSKRQTLTLLKTSKNKKFREYKCGKGFLFRNNILFLPAQFMFD